MRQWRAVVIGALVLAGLPGLSATAAAQDLTTLPHDHPEICVLTTAGEVTTGVLRRFDAGSVTLDLDGHDRVFEKVAIARIYQDDSLRNGMLGGLASGLALAAVATVAWCDGGSASCSGEDFLFVFSWFAPSFGGAGLGIGAAIDALVHRQNLLFQGPAAGSSGTSPVTLHFDRGTARLAVHVRW